MAKCYEFLIGNERKGKASKHMCESERVSCLARREGYVKRKRVGTRVAERIGNVRKQERAR